MKILLLLSPEFDFNNDWQTAFKRFLPEEELFQKDEITPEEVDIAIVYNPPPESLTRFSNLRAIITLSAGADAVLADVCLPDVPIIRLATDDMVCLMREFITYQVIRLHRNFASIEEQQKQREWRWMPPALPASHRRVSILGLGRLGLPCAIALSQLGFKVSGWSKSIKTIPNVCCFIDDGLSTLLSDTDILVCLLPLTSVTHHILSASLFDQLPNGVSLINASRGECLNEQDLLNALDNGKISHASLDVFKTEPLPSAHPFWKHPRITITPHVAADALPLSSMLQIAGTISELRDGRPLSNLISRFKGY